MAVAFAAWNRMWLAVAGIARRHHAQALLLIVLSATAYIGVSQALVRPFWYDEICTVIVARLPNFSAVWKALADAADANPPLFYWIVRSMRALSTDEHIAYRLPSTVGLCGAVILVHLFLRRRLDPMCGVVGASFLLITDATYYAAEARPYALVLLCVATALVSWQRLEDSPWYPLILAASLAAAVSLHYYAVFVWPAFVAAEIAASAHERRLRVRAWLAMGVGLLPLLAFAPLLSSLRLYYSDHFWAKARLSQVLSAPSELVGLKGDWGFVLVVAASLAVVPRIKLNPLTWRPTVLPAPVPAPEAVLMLGMLWLPAVAVIAGLLSGGGMTSRYMLPAVLGAALAFGYSSRCLSASARIGVVMLLLMGAGLSTTKYAKVLMLGRSEGARLQTLRDFQEVLDAYAGSAQPVIVASGLDYLPLHYYSVGRETRAFYAVADPPAAVRFGVSDSVDRALLVLQKYSDIRLADYQSVKESGHPFLLVSFRGGAGDYWLDRILADGLVMRRLPTKGRAQVHLVDPAPARAH